MATLHQAAWQKRGELGAFASERFTGFHRTLIGRAWAKDKIHLAKITAGSDCVGILYSFYDRKKVYFYQSGFNYEPDNRLKPGLLCHALMIEWYTKYGADEYDFVAGDARYKRSLATDSRNLVWSTIDRDNAKMKSLRWLSKCKERVKRARSPATE
jgi:CelD/BcsL family acetyltransferase involved in cellulose biosynthesis